MVDFTKLVTKDPYLVFPIYRCKHCNKQFPAISVTQDICPECFEIEHENEDIYYYFAPRKFDKPKVSNQIVKQKVVPRKKVSLKRPVRYKPKYVNMCYHCHTIFKSVNKKRIICSNCLKFFTQEEINKLHTPKIHKALKSAIYYISMMKKYYYPGFGPRNFTIDCIREENFARILEYNHEEFTYESDYYILTNHIVFKTHIYRAKNHMLYEFVGIHNYIRPKRVHEYISLKDQYDNYIPVKRISNVQYRRLLSWFKDKIDFLPEEKYTVVKEEPLLEKYCLCCGEKFFTTRHLQHFIDRKHRERYIRQTKKQSRHLLNDNEVKHLSKKQISKYKQDVNLQKQTISAHDIFARHCNKKLQYLFLNRYQPEKYPLNGLKEFKYPNYQQFDNKDRDQVKIRQKNYRQTQWKASRPDDIIAPIIEQDEQSLIDSINRSSLMLDKRVNDFITNRLRREHERKYSKDDS